MKKIILTTLALTAIFTSCKESADHNEITEMVNEEVVAEEEVLTFSNSIENAHQKTAFLKEDVVSYDFKVAFGENTMFDGKITQKTDGSMIRMDHKNGDVIMFDGEKVYANNEELANNPMTRFNIFTWSYFFAMPYKLNDAGTNWSDEDMLTFNETTYPTSKLTFEDGIGDTSDDWYIVYKNPETNVLEGVAYIVSFGKTMEEAEAEPHFAKYNKFETVNDIPFATNWTFHNWNKEDGFTDQIGEAVLSNINFASTEENLFNAPENAVEVPMVN